ncbi:MAG: hypothetical protein E4H44_07070, partial [Candidatus Aminicenantes bacterium]
MIVRASGPPGCGSSSPTCGGLPHRIHPMGTRCSLMQDDSLTENHGPNFCCSEIENFVEIVQRIRPPAQPTRHGTIEVYGQSTFLNGAAGGDHIVYLDFDERYDIDRRIR